jgi:hypothetical protein
MTYENNIDREHDGSRRNLAIVLGGTAAVGTFAWAFRKVYRNHNQVVAPVKIIEVTDILRAPSYRGHTQAETALMIASVATDNMVRTKDLVDDLRGRAHYIAKNMNPKNAKRVVDDLKVDQTLFEVLLVDGNKDAKPVETIICTPALLQTLEGDRVASGVVHALQAQIQRDALAIISETEWEV